MTTLSTLIDPAADAFAANAAHNRALATELRAKVAEAALGGSIQHRDRHVARGKLLPRDRVHRLIDAGSPFLEIGQLAPTACMAVPLPARASLRELAGFGVANA